MNVIPLPVFNFAQTRQVARAVGFNPNHAGLARDCLADVQDLGMNFPAWVSDRQRFRALFYIALGAFLYSRYVELGEPLPAFVADWYAENTALTAGGSDATGLFMGLSR